MINYELVYIQDIQSWGYIGRSVCEVGTVVDQNIYRFRNMQIDQRAGSIPTVQLRMLD
jgi:hypothetical protein